MLDHLALQDDSKMFFSHIYKLSRSREFKYIDSSLIKNKIDKTTSLYCNKDVRQMDSLKDRVLIDECMNQGILSVFYSEISYKDQVFGYLRCDSTSTIRIWQNSHMNLLVTAAKAIAMVLYFTGKKLSDLD